MLTPSSAHTFFDEILSYSEGSFFFLEKLSSPDAFTDENEWRDFKGAKELTEDTGGKAPDNIQKEKDRKTREIWSEYLGAFANSGGGVLIWGINAPKRYADGTSFVSDVYKFSERLIDLAKTDIDPPVQGIEVRPIPRGFNDPEGFVVCMVPQSKFAPHRSTQAKREYYVRCQDGNQPCPVAVLRRLFYPLTFSYLVPVVQLWATWGDDKSFHLQGCIDILNKGHASAAEVFVTFSGSQIISLNSRAWEQSHPNLHNYHSHKSIHPGQVVRFAHNLSSRSGFSDWPDVKRSESFSISIYARDSLPICRSFTILWTELRSAYERDQRSKITTEGEEVTIS